MPPPSPAPEALRWPGAAREAEQLADAIARAATRGAPDTLARLHRLANYNQLQRADAALDRAIEAVLAADRAPALSRDHARFLRAQRARERGRPADAAADLDALGLVRAGLWRGPFDNAAGAGHTATHAPERSATLDPGWRSFEGLVPAGRIELGQLCHPAGPNSAYVAVAARAERRVRAALRIGATDAVRAWVNGQRVVDDDGRRFAALDQTSVGVTLEAGLNLVLVKVSWSEAQGQLYLRLSAPAGGPLGGVQLDGSRAGVEAAWAAHPMNPAPAKAFPVTGALPPAPRGRAATAEALALRADLVAVLGLYDRRKQPSPPEVLLRQAIAAAPADPRLRFYYAHRVRRRDPSHARAQLSAALTADPGYALAQLALGTLSREGGRLLEARRFLDAATVADPDLAGAHLARASLGYEMLDEESLALARLHRAMQARPALASQPKLQVQLARMRRGLGDRAGARAAAEAALALDGLDAVARSLAAELALDAEDPRAGLAQLERRVGLSPTSLPRRLHLARVLAGLPGRLDDALRTVEQAAAVFPAHPEVPALEAELRQYAGDPSGAERALRRTLELDPHQPAARRHLRAFAGQGDRLEAKYAIDARSRLATPVSPAEARWGAIYLADRKVIRLFENGKSVRFQQSILRMNNPRLEDSLRGHRIPYAPSRETVEILAAERIRKTGEVVPAAQIRDEGPRGKVSGMYIDQRYKLIGFDALEAGDLVHIQYRVDTVGENIFGGFFGDVTAAQDVLPKQDFFFRAITPTKRPLHHTHLGMAPPVQSTSEAGVELTWTAATLPGLELEPHAPPYPDIGRLISVSTYADWDALGAWYGRLFAEQMELDDAARAAGRRVVEGASDDAEKVRRLYDYVVKNTRYVGIELGIHGWKPYPASEVHRRRYGDCKDKATLLATLLEDNGVPATITLVRTRDRGRLPPDHATMWAFNHAITYVPGLDLFLDPTAEFNGSTELPYPDQGAMALVVHPDGRTRRLTLPSTSAEQNVNRSTYRAVLSRDTRLVMEGTERFSGARAAELRREFEEPEQRIRQLEEPLTELLPGAEVESASFSDLSDLEVPVEYTYRFSVPRYGRRDGDRVTLPVALYRHQVASAYAQLATRRHPVHLTHPWKTQNVIRYRLPEGAEIESMPDGAVIEGPYISLVQRVRRTEDGFETDDTVVLHKRIVPAEDYPAFREACLAIDRAMARKVVVRW